MHKTTTLEFRAEPVTPKTLTEQRAEAMKEMQSLLDTAKKENRAMTEDETNRLSQLEKSVGDIDRSFEAEKRALELLNKPAPENDPEPDKPSGKEDEAGAEKRAAPITEDDKRTFMNIVNNIAETRAGEQNFSIGNNTVLIPTTIAHRIISEVKERCPVFAGATHYSVKGKLTIPVYGDKVVDGQRHNITVGYAQDFKELVADAGAFSSVELSGYLVGVLTLIGKQLLTNSEIPIFDYIITQMSKAISEWIENELLTGDGVDGCTGILTSSNIIQTGSTSLINADMLIDAQSEIPTVYQRGCCWTMNPKTFNMLRKLKDSTGQYLLQSAPNIINGFPYTVLGKPVYLSDFMPLPGEDSKAIIYGDYSALAVNMREQIEIEVLRENYHTMHAIGIDAWFDLDSKVTDKQKIVVMQMSAA